jgi:aminoglycoside 2'-N-acetyltransferase I
MQITTHRAADLTDDDRASMERYFYTPNPADHYLRRRDGDQLISLVAITDRVITVGGQSVRVGGIGDVSTREDQRGQGHASMLLREAARFMFDDLGVAFGMLFCGESRIPFYEHLGWTRIQQPAHWIDEAGAAQIEPYFMILAPAGSAWPEGEVDLCGRDW